MLPAASAGAIFQASMSSGKFHGINLRGDAQGSRDPAGEGVVELVGPAGVVPEVAGGEGHVDVAALLDGLARVHRFEDGELAAALLEEAGDTKEVLGPLLAGELAPRIPLRLARGADRLVDVGLRRAGHLGQRLFRRRIDRREGLTAGRGDLPAVDEQAVARLERDDVAGLGGRGVIPRDGLPITKPPAVGRARARGDDARGGAAGHARHYGTGSRAGPRSAISGLAVPSAVVPGDRVGRFAVADVDVVVVAGIPLRQALGDQHRVIEVDHLDVTGRRGADGLDERPGNRASSRPIRRLPRRKRAASSSRGRARRSSPYWRAIGSTSPRGSSTPPIHPSRPSSPSIPPTRTPSVVRGSRGSATRASSSPGTTTTAAAAASRPSGSSSTRAAIPAEASSR